MDDCVTEAILDGTVFADGVAKLPWRIRNNVGDSKCDEVYRDNGTVKSTQVVTPVDSLHGCVWCWCLVAFIELRLPGYVGLPADGADVYAATGA
jgi:hypothetical protein